MMVDLSLADFSGIDDERNRNMELRGSGRDQPTRGERPIGRESEGKEEKTMVDLRKGNDIAATRGGGAPCCVDARCW